MSNITVQDIERDPLAFVRRIEAGESLRVLSGDRALAEVHPVLQPNGDTRPYGLCAGQFETPADFDEPLPDDIVKEFEGA